VRGLGLYDKEAPSSYSRKERLAREKTMRGPVPPERGGEGGLRNCVIAQKNPEKAKGPHLCEREEKIPNSTRGGKLWTPV